jgi:hypothetical protein
MPAQKLNTSLQWTMAEPNPLEETFKFLTNSDSNEDLPKNTLGPSKNQRRLEGYQNLQEDYLVTMDGPFISPKWLVRLTCSVFRFTIAYSDCPSLP